MTPPRLLPGATRRELACLSAQPLDVFRAFSGHVPHLVAALDQDGHGPRIEVLRFIAPTRPMELGGPIGGEVLATDRAMCGPLGRPRPVALPTVGPSVVRSPPPVCCGIGANLAL